MVLFSHAVYQVWRVLSFFHGELFSSMLIITMFPASLTPRICFYGNESLNPVCIFSVHRFTIRYFYTEESKSYWVKWFLKTKKRSHMWWDILFLTTGTHLAVKGIWQGTGKYPGAFNITPISLRNNLGYSAICSQYSQGLFPIAGDRVDILSNPASVHGEPAAQYWHPTGYCSQDRHCRGSAHGHGCTEHIVCFPEPPFPSELLRDDRIQQLRLHASSRYRMLRKHRFSRSNGANQGAWFPLNFLLIDMWKALLLAGPEIPIHRLFAKFPFTWPNFGTVICP